VLIYTILLMLKMTVIGHRSGVVKHRARQFGFIIDNNNPRIVISYGGDGTCLESELKYPGIPKLFLKHDSDCKGCKSHDFSKIFEALENRDYRIIKTIKIEGRIKGKKFIALNDINFNYRPPRALRFQVKVGSRMVNSTNIGDGVVIATPFGSTGYFKSITRGRFKKGIGSPMILLVLIFVPILLRTKRFGIPKKITKKQFYLIFISMVMLSVLMMFLLVNFFSYTDYTPLENNIEVLLDGWPTNDYVFNSLKLDVSIVNLKDIDIRNVTFKLLVRNGKNYNNILSTYQHNFGDIEAQGVSQSKEIYISAWCGHEKEYNIISVEVESIDLPIVYRKDIDRISVCYYS